MGCMAWDHRPERDVVRVPDESSGVALRREGVAEAHLQCGEAASSSSRAEGGAPPTVALRLSGSLLAKIPKGVTILSKRGHVGVPGIFGYGALTCSDMSHLECRIFNPPASCAHTPALGSRLTVSIFRVSVATGYRFRVQGTNSHREVRTGYRVQGIGYTYT